MTLAETLLQKVSDWRPTGDGRHSLTTAVPEVGWTATLTTDKADTLSVLAWELTLTRTGDTPEGATLHGWAERIASRASGLLEPLKLHEVDNTVGEAVLRSVSPTVKGEILRYTEVRLSGLGHARVRRYQASHGTSKREQVAFVLSHEALAKLAGDIAE